MSKKVEVSGKTLESAMEKGLSLLGLSDPNEVVVTVLKDNGFLFNKYKILLEKKMSEAELAVGFLETLLSKAGFDFALDVTEDDDAVTVNLVGLNSASIIGYHGEMLDSLQYLTGMVVNRDRPEFKRVIVNTEGYREKRIESLQKLASNLEKKVERTHTLVNLEPMNSYERRIIHATLQDSLIVTTYSEGAGINRHVIIAPKRQDKKSSVADTKKPMSFVYSSDKKRRTGPAKR